MRGKSWREIPLGGMIMEVGSATAYKTGSWRTLRPSVDKETCSDCLRCWIHCPDSSIKVNDENMTGFDYDHCKGCGVCSSICPVDAITMERE
jgi:pyruvate ferredoxin oxidoreductase delta subunit